MVSPAETHHSDDEGPTAPSLVGILAAFEILHEVMISQNIASPEQLARAYATRAQLYCRDIPEAAVFLDLLVRSLCDPKFRPIEALLHRKTDGSA